MRKIFFSLCIALLAWAPQVAAQPLTQMVKVIVAPDHTDWVYKPGEQVKFSVTVLKNGNPLPQARISYTLGPERMKPFTEGTAVLPAGQKTLEGVTLKTPGFLRCVVKATVDGKMYKGLATAGFSPLSIEPTVSSPADFEEFWNGARADLAKVPMDAKMTLLPERCTEKVNVYEVNIQNVGVSRLYGVLCVPKKAGKYPALLRVPGAGVRPYNGDIASAEKGIITLEIGIHGIPVTLDPGVYTDLGAGSLRGYYNYNLDDRDRFYYKRVYLGCIRANDFLTSLPEYDGTNLGVYGGSQGGALSIVTASLDSRVKYLAAMYPALSDVTGYLKGRAGGWPHYFNAANAAVNNTPEKLKAIPYYDVVNFARRLKQEGFYAWGYNDETCPPTSMYAAYNTIKAPKQLYLALETGHWSFPEEREVFTNWICNKLLGR